MKVIKASRQDLIDLERYVPLVEHVSRASKDKASSAFLSSLVPAMLANKKRIREVLSEPCFDATVPDNLVEQLSAASRESLQPAEHTKFLFLLSRISGKD